MSGRSSRRATWWYIVRLIRFRPWLYLALGVLETLFFGVFPQLIGWITFAFFETLSKPTAGLGIWHLVALLMGVAAGRAVAIFFDVAVYFHFKYSIAALLRRNLFAHLLGRPGARAVPGSAGEAITHFRDDVDEVSGFMAESLILLGFGFFALVALVVMLRIDARITLAVFVPLVLVVVVVYAASSRIERYRELFRKATGDVTDFIGETFGAVQGVQVATAESRMVERFRHLNEARRASGLRDKLLSALVTSVFENTASLGTGAVLLLAAQQMRGGAFTVGEFALFVYYLGFVTDFTGLIGERWAWYKRVGVSVARLLGLLQDASPDRLVEPHPVYMHGELPDVPQPSRTMADRLETLDVTGLTCTYSDSGRGVHGVNLRLRRGSLTVITGRVGSGKTTLLRGLLGLLPRESGEIRWNDRVVADPATFFIPPRCAYTAQVPVLFSESLRDNILMGLTEDDVDLPGALRAAVMEQDVAELEHGLDTVVGAKGVKLSGGQRQRAAAARMFVRTPELLVFDDLSSALDVETEHTLWERLDGGDALGEPRTCLVVSHRRPALLHADHILVLKDGRVEAEGTLADLLESCEEMRSLWHGEQSHEAARP